MKDSMGKSGKAGEGEGKNGKQGMSKELAEMAAKQAAIRQMMDKMGQDLNEDGSGAGNGIKQIAKEMEQVEEDIVNKNITQETLKRQEDILIRLLEAEEAERTRGQEEKRKSKSGNQELRGTPANLDEYRKQKEKEIELLRTMPPSLKPYYKDKVNDYFNNLDR
jgi:chromosome segregation ATPase